MDSSLIIMWLGFILASYAVVGNDAIQTLGTFLSSNEKRPWWLLWLFAGSLLVITLVYGWVVNVGDVAYGRLGKYPLPEPFAWYYVLPPLVLMIVTRSGIPVSTSFMVLTFFNTKGLWKMTSKSLMGYGLALLVGLIVYSLITKIIEKKFLQNPLKKNEAKLWSTLQVVSTGFLWSQWLIQDFANIYVYLPRSLSTSDLIFSIIIILTMLGLIFYYRGGKIQNIVKAKTNTTDIRSATIIDFIYALILLYFKELNNVPMSTTWVFLGLLAGREIAMRYHLKSFNKEVIKDLGRDLAKMTLGLLISVGLVVIIYLSIGKEIKW